LVELQVKLTGAPVCRLAGLAVKVAVGAAATVTAAVAVALPPAPVQVSVKLAFAVSAAVARLPLVGSAPVHPPLAVHAVAS
jgi:hypothetical protein